MEAEVQLPESPRRFECRIHQQQAAATSPRSRLAAASQQQSLANLDSVLAAGAEAGKRPKVKAAREALKLLEAALTGVVDHPVINMRIDSKIVTR